MRAPRLPPTRYGIVSQRSSRPPKKSAIRFGASRKSIAFRVGGVSMTMRSYSPVAWISNSRSIAM